MEDIKRIATKYGIEPEKYSYYCGIMKGLEIANKAGWNPTKEDKDKIKTILNSFYGTGLK